MNKSKTHENLIEQANSNVRNKYINISIYGENNNNNNNSIIITNFQYFKKKTLVWI